MSAEWINLSWWAPREKQGIPLGAREAHFEFHLIPLDMALCLVDKGYTAEGS